jgi:hypothetical protein
LLTQNLRVEAGLASWWSPRSLRSCSREARACEDRITSIDILDREIFSEAEAARLLRVAQGTLHYWLEGGTRRGKEYPPVIPTEPRDTRTVTWAEFVEAGMLRQYRRELLVPMLELKSFIDRLRDRLAIPYPLAHSQPFVGDGRQLVGTLRRPSGWTPSSVS